MTILRFVAYSLVGGFGLLALFSGVAHVASGDYLSAWTAWSTMAVAFTFVTAASLGWWEDGEFTYQTPRAVKGAFAGSFFYIFIGQLGISIFFHDKGGWYYLFEWLFGIGGVAVTLLAIHSFRMAFKFRDYVRANIRFQQQMDEHEERQNQND